MIKDSKDASFERSEIKIRGISLTYDASLQLHFESMQRLVKQMVTGGSDAIKLLFKQIKRPRLGVVRTVDASKRYRPVFTKGRLLSDFSVLPYGF